MLRDESVYPDPHAFNPARFLAPADEATVKRRDPRHYVFGFGRRRCPGAHLIEQSLWTVIATAVATLDIHKPIGPDGKTLEQKVVFENSVFRCAPLCLLESVIADDVAGFRRHSNATFGRGLARR